MAILDNIVKQDHVCYFLFVLKFNYIIFLLLKALCSSIICSNGGTCLSLSGGTSWKCLCQSGYTGDRCQQLIGGEFLKGHSKLIRT